MSSSRYSSTPAPNWRPISRRLADDHERAQQAVKQRNQSKRAEKAEVRRKKRETYYAFWRDMSTNRRNGVKAAKGFYARTKMQIQKLPEVPEAQPVNRAVRRSLPKQCSACGAPVSSAEVAFGENGTADCHYCGTVLLG